MGKRILIVDDSLIMRKMIKETLKGGNHSIVGEAKNGKDAVALYLDCRPDLVTMDITMREMDGFEAAREILKVDENARIIFLSNLDQDKYGKEAKRLGAMGFVNKHQPKSILNLIDAL